MKVYASIMLMVACAVTALASEPFNGLLINLNGKPVKGAKIYVHSPKQYAKSDKDGKFGLTDVKAADTIHVQVKKMTYAVPVNGSKGMRITIGELSAEGAEDQELIRMGTGYVKKREYLGPRSGVTGEQLAATGQSDLIQAMRGLVPGVNISEDGTNLVIRNSSSVNSNPVPLWIVDGSESTTPPSVTVMEVERVEILKDGAGYGTRGANGVILVTLKGSN